MKLTTTTILLSVLAGAAHAQSVAGNAQSAAGSYSGSALNYQQNSTGNYAASVIAPSITAITADACAMASGASAAGGGFFSLGFVNDRADKRCGNEADAAGWHVLGDNVMAQAMLCRTPGDAATYLATHGTPCPGQPGYVPGTAPVAATAAQRPIVLSANPDVTTEQLNDESLASNGK
jgi:hypothetical protein